MRAILQVPNTALTALTLMLGARVTLVDNSGSPVFHVTFAAQKFQLGYGILIGD